MNVRNIFVLLPEHKQMAAVRVLMDYIIIQYIYIVVSTRYRGGGGGRREGRKF